jgi:hypothetical protein
VLGTDPDFARDALSAIEESTRNAVRDLHHVLGLLRADRPVRDQQGSLADLDFLARNRRRGTDRAHRGQR